MNKKSTMYWSIFIILSIVIIIILINIKIQDYNPNQINYKKSLGYCTQITDTTYSNNLKLEPIIKKVSISYLILKIIGIFILFFSLLVFLIFAIRWLMAYVYLRIRLFYLFGIVRLKSINRLSL